MTIQVTPLQEEDIPGAVQVIQEAFKDDPYNNWIFDKETFNPHRNARSLALRCRWGMSQGIFHVARDDSSSPSPSSPNPNPILGVACWLPPSSSSPSSSSFFSSSYLASATLTLGQILNNLTHLGRGGLRLPRYKAWKEAQREVQDRVWRSGERNQKGQEEEEEEEDDRAKYYFLNIMVVTPEAQGRGIGRAMMEAVTRRADEEGYPCYLESSRDVPNVAIYGRFGFRCAAELVCRDKVDKGDEGITLFAMVREPGAGPLSAEEARRMPSSSSSS